MDARDTVFAAVTGDGSASEVKLINSMNGKSPTGYSLRKISPRKVVYGSKCGVPGCLGHHCIHHRDSKLVLPLSFTYLLKPEEEKADRLGRAIAVEVCTFGFRKSTFEDIMKSISSGDSESREIVRTVLKAQSKDGVPGYLEAAMSTKRSQVRFYCLRKTFHGGMTAVICPDPYLPEGCISIPDSVSLGSSICIAMRNPVMDVYGIPPLHNQYHPGDSCIFLHPATIERMLGDCDGDTVSVLAIHDSNSGMVGCSPSGGIEQDSSKFKSATMHISERFNIGDLLSCFQGEFNPDSMSGAIVNSGVVKDSCCTGHISKGLRSVVWG